MYACCCANMHTYLLPGVPCSQFAFTSTTKKREVALHYANPNQRSPILFDIQMGMVHRGAEFSWLSQYPQ